MLKLTKFKLKIRIFGGKPINVIKCLSPHAYAQQNFRIFWVGMHSRGNKEAITYGANKSKHIVKI